MRHFNWQRYNRPGIKDILNMNDYVDLVVGKIDRYNAGEYEDSWDKEEIIRDLLHFCDYLLVAIGDATWKDVEAFQIMTKRVKDLEISLGIRKKSPPPKKPTKPSDDEKKEVEKIAALLGRTICCPQGNSTNYEKSVLGTQNAFSASETRFYTQGNS